MSLCLNVILKEIDCLCNFKVMSIHINVTLIGCGVCWGAAETRIDYLVTSIPMEGVFSREFGERPGNDQTARRT